MNLLFALKKVIRWCLYILSALCFFVLGYMVCAYALARYSVNADTIHKADNQIYITTNGVHTDLILPVKTAQMDWSVLFPYANTTGNDSTQAYIGIGWGDKGFYLNTPEWADLTATTAFNAVCGLGGTAVHATYHAAIPQGETCIPLSLSFDEYQQLVAYIKQSLRVNEQGIPVHIHTNANYGSSDAFYESNGRYSLFSTCNTWTNNALKSCNQKACLWTPFQSGIFNQYNNR
jgi:uncharacterized protein (TIGR02117 family)